MKITKPILDMAKTDYDSGQIIFISENNILITTIIQRTI